MLIWAIGGIQMAFLADWRLFWPLEAILECDLETDPVTLTLTFQGHKVRWKKVKSQLMPQTHWQNIRALIQGTVSI